MNIVTDGQIVEPGNKCKYLRSMEYRSEAKLRKRKESSSQVLKDKMTREVSVKKLKIILLLTRKMGRRVKKAIITEVVYCLAYAYAAATW